MHNHALGAASVILAASLAACTKSTPATKYSSAVDPGGCIVEQITTGEMNEFQVFGVSNDGQWLSMSWNTGYDDNGVPIGGVNLVDLVSGETRELASGLNNSGAFSSDGVYHVSANYGDDGITDIVEVHVETGATETIAAHEAWDWLPSYSPDDRYILFNSYREGDQADIYVYERSTGALERLTEHPGYEAHAQFSPDGERVLFHRMNATRDDGGYDFDLFSIDLATRTETRLTDLPVEESYAAYAPDGQHIVLSSDLDADPEKHNLYVLAPDGEFVTQLTDNDWKDSYAYWTRDGRYIYYNSDRSESTNIFRLPMNGNDCVREQ